MKRKHTNFKFFSTNFDILTEMDLKYALAFLLVGFILSVKGQGANGPEGTLEQADDGGVKGGAEGARVQGKECVPRCQGTVVWEHPDNPQANCQKPYWA